MKFQLNMSKLFAFEKLEREFAQKMRFWVYREIKQVLILIKKTNERLKRD